MLEFIDTHAHLTDSEFENTKFDNEFFEAEGFRVSKCITVAYDLDSLKKVANLANSYDNIYGELGIHPDDADDFGEEAVKIIREAVKSKKIVAIGEIGLDYYWDKSFVELQKEVFAKQIRLANELNLPIAVHDREAHKDTFDIIKSENKGSDVLFHCFSGSVEFMRECVKQGWYIALGGVVTFKNAVKMKDVAKEVPLEKLVLETDSPYLTPVPFRGKTNYPSYVKYVAEEIANLRAMPVEELIGITTENAERLFKI